MPDSNSDEAREALLAQADEAWPDDPARDPEVLGRSGDHVSCYLRAYYQRVATEDLAPPARLAAVAQAHAQLGLRRPQGRALVQVRDPGDLGRVVRPRLVRLGQQGLPGLVYLAVRHRAHAVRHRVHSFVSTYWSAVFPQQPRFVPNFSGPSTLPPHCDRAISLSNTETFL